eukprot:TRINITY_DN38370_c0_g1_i1.p1 TRINITY_DN38370_c0_g1~~TRINITY_DN38370_c0_g1_i1.p1  ORF type:complete len:488 (+),score=110.76 TRINITY_DN38370_c0_g1_i1:75-1466(+)
MGTPLPPGLSPLPRAGEAQQAGCLCSSTNCGCADALSCASDGKCHACGDLDCRYYAGSRCSCGLASACNQQTGRCTAAPNTVPSACAGLSCISGQGTPVWDGTSCRCQCGVQYTGDNCGACAYGYTQYPSCVSQSSAGSNCQATYCRNHGSAFWSSAGVCACQCQRGYAGAYCDTCEAGYSGYPTCTSTYSQSCSALLCQNRGQPYWSVPQSRCLCSCTAGFGGDTCEMCAAGYVGYPSCAGPTGIGSAQCVTVSCGAYGSPQWNGISCRCVCNQGYSGSGCAECATGFTGYPTCVVSRGFGVGGNPTTATATGSPPAVVRQDSDDDDTAIIVAVVVVSALLLLISIAGLLYFLCFRAKARQATPAKNEGPHPPTAPHKTSVPPTLFYAQRPPPKQVSAASTPAGISVISEHDDAPQHNPIRQSFPPPPPPQYRQQQQPPPPQLTQENAEHNNFLHRRDGTYA